MLLWLGYVAGTLGVLVEWRAYVLSCDQDFRRWSAMGAVLWALMYGALGAWTAAVTMGSTALRTLFSARALSRLHRHVAASAFTVLFVGLTAVSWQGTVSLLPALAVINTTWALFYLDNHRMRVVLLASSAAWITNDIIWQAWPALLAESVAALLNIRTLRRLRATARTLGTP